MIMSHEVRTTFELHSRATWTVAPCPVVEGTRHPDDAGAQGGGTSTDTIAFLWLFHH